LALLSAQKLGIACPVHWLRLCAKMELHFIDRHEIGIAVSFLLVLWHARVCSHLDLELNSSGR
jgi:hypothetical protein